MGMLWNLVMRRILNNTLQDLEGRVEYMNEGSCPNCKQEYRQSLGEIGICYCQYKEGDTDPQIQALIDSSNAFKKEMGIESTMLNNILYALEGRLR